MPNTDKKIFAVILDYDDFRNMSEERRLKMLAENKVEWRVYIPHEIQEKLTEYETKQLEGFVITDVPPVKVRIFDKKDLFPKEVPELIDSKKQEKFTKREDRKRFKRSIPLKIGRVNTKKKGGR